jgi:hypothetical protein
MSQKFSFSRDISCRINVDSRPLSRTTFGWLEGHGLGSSEGDDGCSNSQESLGETNRDTNFTSSNGLWVRCCFAIGLSGREIGAAKAVFPNFSLRLPWEVFLEKVF